MDKKTLNSFGKEIKTTERKRLLRGLLLSAVILGVIVIGYKFYNGDFKFLFKDVGYTKALVVETYEYPSLAHSDITRQRIRYEYTLENKHYVEVWDATILAGFYRVGEKIDIKYALDDPSIHEVVDLE